jgi:putative DNA primase/helicase
VVVTSPNGSKSADKADWSPLHGRDVVIWPDADLPGDEYAKGVSKCAAAGEAKSIAVVSPPEAVKEGWDAADALDEGWTPDRVAELIAHAAPVTGPSDAPDGSVTALDKIQEEIRRLASLSIIEYELERTKAAESLGMRTSVLDEAVKSAQPSTEDKKGQGRPFELLAIEPWPSAVNGAELLSEVSEAIKRYVVLPANSAETLALWALHTYCFDCFAHSPRAAVTSPEKGCGKTTTLDVLECLVSRPLPTANATAAAIFRIVEQARPTLLIDEADTFLKENDELRGILNTGHRRGGQVLRTVGDDHEPRQFSTWAPAAIAMIGRLPDTLNDRSVIINLRRRKPTEKVKSFRRDRADDLRVLARKMARWAQDHQAHFADSDPDVGDLMNRMADNWRPLLAIADVAGGHWPKRVREIAAAADRASIEQSATILLLEDIRWIFDGRPELEDGRTVLRAATLERISSADLVAQLVEIEGRPWAEWKAGKPITQNGLARMLGKFEILPGTIRLHTGQTAKGYYRSAFEDAFSYYLASQTVTTSQLNNDGHCDALQSVTPEELVTLSKASQTNNDGHCDGVTVSNPPSRRMGSIDL